MCGIVGVAGSGPMSHQMKEFMQDLLFHGIVRGKHATGVAAIDTLDRSLTVMKKAVPSPIFLEDKEMMEPLFAHKHNFNIYIGHNRFATQGSKDDDANAHPFVHGDIVGVHNGTLRNQRLLDDHKDFVVDSDNLYHHLNKNGLDDTVTKLNGAFSLVWYDKSNNSLNFIRNDERPMTIAKLSNGYWVWASERGMLTWLINRHKTLSIATEEDKETKTTTQQIWSLDVGLHFALHYKDKTRQFDKPHAAQKVLPKFPTTSYGNYGNYAGGYDSGWDRGSNSNHNSSTRNRGYTPPSAPFRSEYAKKGDDAVGKWLPGGSQLSALEVEFLGHYTPSSPSGYKQNISLFLYRNVRGEEITLFCYNHGGNIASQWDEPEDIGRMCYASISSAQPVGAATYDGTRTDGHDYVFVLHQITEKPPAAHYAYYTKEQAEAAQAKAATRRGKREAKTTDNKEGDSGQVLPFRPKSSSATNSKDASQGQQATLTGSEVNKTALSKVVKGIFAVVEKPGEKVVFNIANDTLSLWKFKEFLHENHGLCCNCGQQLRDIALDRVWLIEYYDREKGETSNWLTCSAICHEDIKGFVHDLNEDYDKKLGVQGND